MCRLFIYHGKNVVLFFQYSLIETSFMDNREKVIVLYSLIETSFMDNREKVIVLFQRIFLVVDLLIEHDCLKNHLGFQE